MPNKSKKVQFHKDVKRRRIRKSLSERIKRLSRKESHYRTCQDEAISHSIDSQQQMVKVEHKDKLFFKKGVINFIQSLNSRINSHVNFLLFGMIYFDEDALNSHHQDRSLLKSMFNFYSVNYVKITPAFLIIKIQLNFQNTYPAPYIIDRFKSLGKKQFLLLAQVLQGIYSRFVNLEKVKTPSLYDHQVEKQLLKSQGKPCMLMISPDTIAFSKELIELTGYTMESMASSCLLNRSFLFDLFLSDNYMDEVISYMIKFGQNGRLRRGEVTKEEYREATSYHYHASIIDKQNNKIKLVTKRSHLDIGIAFWEVQKVIGKEKLIQQINLPQLKDRINFQNQKKQREEQEILNLASRSASKIQPPPVSAKVCGYKIIKQTKIEAYQ